jgi:membrane associated rhomboid family serine protease
VLFRSGALMHVMVDPSATAPMVGASGAICGLLAVGAVLRPRFLVFVGVFAAINIWYALTASGGGVSYGSHIGGFAVGFVVAALLRGRHDALEGTT